MIIVKLLSEKSFYFKLSDDEKEIALVERYNSGEVPMNSKLKINNGASLTVSEIESLTHSNDIGKLPSSAVFFQVPKIEKIKVIATDQDVRDVLKKAREHLDDVEEFHSDHVKRVIEFVRNSDGPVASEEYLTSAVMTISTISDEATRERYHKFIQGMIKAGINPENLSNSVDQFIKEGLR